jgi:hypothetical protein
MDADGYSIEGGSCGAIDCNDNDASINPGAVEICSDSIDNNCNGLTDSADANAIDCPLDCIDSDGDGYSIDGGSCGPVDCDDTNADINPAAMEICGDGIDNNCNSLMDETDNVCCEEHTGNEIPWWRKHKIHCPNSCDHHGRDDSDEEYEDDDEYEDDEHSERRPRRWHWWFR